jgi:FtsZ-interacting cell division protein YlmF
MTRVKDFINRIFLYKYREVGDVESEEIMEPDDYYDENDDYGEYENNEPEDKPIKTDWLNKDNHNSQTKKILVNAVIARPVDMDCAQLICDELKKGSICTINLEAASKDMKQRIADLISGVIYAKDGHIKNVSDTVIIATPASVPITDGLIKEVKRRGYDFRGSRKYS